jgi:hypothetical protein
LPSELWTGCSNWSWGTLATLSCSKRLQARPAAQESTQWLWWWWLVLA